MFKRLDAIKKRSDFLKKELNKQEIISDVKKTTKYSKELYDLSEIVNVYEEILHAQDEIVEAKQLVHDKELGEFAKEEIEKLTQVISEKTEHLEVLLLPKDPNDGKNIVIEIRGAAGGDEANIFAGNLFEMYSRYAATQGFNVEVVDTIEGTSGGFSQIVCMIKGKDVYSKLKYESGVHRVQRVPDTETQGRVHTSTATVAVMPEAEELDFEIHPSDLKIDVYRSGGPGGQGVNTTDSAVRITHLPTNIVVTCQNERSQLKNKDVAMKMLRIRLHDATIREQEEKIGAERKSKIGSGDRSEKIRTYNYAQNRITDHRINLTIKELDRVMNGKLDDLVEELINEDQKRKLEGQNED